MVHDRVGELDIGLDVRAEIRVAGHAAQGGGVEAPEVVGAPGGDLGLLHIVHLRGVSPADQRLDLRAGLERRVLRVPARYLREVFHEPLGEAPIGVAQLIHGLFPVPHQRVQLGEAGVGLAEDPQYRLVALETGARCDVPAPSAAEPVSGLYERGDLGVKHRGHLRVPVEEGDGLVKLFRPLDLAQAAGLPLREVYEVYGRQGGKILFHLFHRYLFVLLRLVLVSSRALLLLRLSGLHKFRGAAVVPL